MSPKMSPMLFLTAALSVGWLVWSLWYKVSPARRLPGIPLVEFDGNNSRERYTRDAASLVRKGYEKVTPVAAIPLWSSIIDVGTILTAYKT